VTATAHIRPLLRAASTLLQTRLYPYISFERLHVGAAVRTFADLSAGTNHASGALSSTERKRRERAQAK